MPKAGWREYVIAGFLLLAGLIYLILQVISVIRGDRSPVNADAEMIHINRYAFLNEVRTYLTILCSVAGGVLLIRKQKAGWILSLCMLLLFTTIAVAATVNLFVLSIDKSGKYIGMGGSTLMLLFIGILFSLRRKFVLKKNDWIMVILLCTTLGLFYFLLQ
ncbi:MAG TPA: hypothetical protein VLC28_03410 [Flavitalea sp.]|nr:hypothetical protein [Flavitalea sp.]